MSCDKVVSFYEKQGKDMAGLMLGSWVHGFISGINAGRSALNKDVTVGSNKSADEVWDMTLAYCHTYPNDRLELAAQQIY